MAFKMTFPIIKDSPVHKEATSVVSQSRTSADPSLIYAADEMGKSTVPGAIDYKLKYSPDLEFSKDEREPKPKPDLEPKPPKTVEEKFDDTYSEKEAEIRKKGGYDYDPEKDKDSTRKERKTYKKKQKEDFEKMIVTPEGEEEAFNRAEEAYNKQKEEEENSALQLRKQSIFKNAIKGGKIQKELIKQGFDPYK